MDRCTESLARGSTRTSSTYYDYEYFTDRSGKTWILVQNGAQEQKVLSRASLPHITVKRMIP